MQEFIQGLPEPMQFNITMLVIAAIFLVLMFLLNSMVFKPLVEVLDERRRRVEEGAEAQKKSMQTVEESMAAYREAVIEARRKAQQRRQDILKESEVGRNEIISSAKERALALVQAEVTNLADQVEEAKAALRNERRELAERIVASVLSRASS